MPNFRLDRLSALESIVGPGRQPTQAMQLRWQKHCEKIEDAFDEQAAINAELASQLAQILAAQEAADLARRNDSISASWTSPGTILTASDAGTDATITIAAHSRKYGDTTEVSVNGGSLTGLAYSTKYYLYYDQTSRAGGVVTYLSATNPNTALPNAAEGRHFCGFVTTPASGGGDTSGGVSPPGSGGSLDGTDIP